MRKSTLLLLCASAAVAFSAGANARGPEGAGGFTHGSPVGPGSNGSAYENSNGRFAQDRDQGLQRAEDRMSTEGQDHSQASYAQTRRHRGAHDSAARHAPQRDSAR